MKRLLAMMESERHVQMQRTACRRCHYRKVKCDALPGRPCTGCRNSGFNCIAYQKRRRNRDPYRDVSMPLPNIQPAQKPSGVPNSEDGPNPQDTRSDAWEESPPESTSSAGESRSHETVSNNNSQDPENAYRNERDEVDEAAAALSAMQDAGIQRHLVEMLSQEDIDKRVIQKGVRIVYVGQEFSNMNYLIRHRARNEAVHHFPSSQISRQYTSHHLDRIPKEAFHLPSPAVVDDLLKSYFSYVNPGCPILDEEVFMRQYQSRDPLDPPSLLVLQAVLLVGAHVSHHRPDRDDLKSAFFRRAKMLFDARFEGNRDVVVQAALLLTWHTEGVEDIGANSYYWVSVAVRTAFGLGMHRDCGASTLIAQDRRIWRRLWWILVQFDVQVALSYGRPQGINLDDADVPPLVAQDFEGLRGNVDMDFVCHHAELCAIMSRVLRDRFGLHVSPARKMAALEQADQLMAEWMARLPLELRPRESTGDQSMWSCILHIAYNNFLILLHRPPPKLVTEHTVQTEDIEICSSAASTLVSLFDWLLRRNELRCVNAFAVNALFTTLIQISAQMRVKNPVLGTKAMAKFDTALGALRALSDYWLNARIIQQLFEESSERLRQELRIGRSTVPPPMVSQNVDYTPFNDSGVSVQDDSDGLSAPWCYMEGVAHDDSRDPGLPEMNNNGLLDWSHLYWENSGFNCMNSFGDLGLYQPI
ncbi:fungal-specific transcription factor domain-containing protein [Xylariales sp. PMI_506]|nr:fungal-specific transcription factor domain-containing protein [Xylariales sp. PMI_506]